MRSRGAKLQTKDVAGSCAGGDCESSGSRDLLSVSISGRKVCMCVCSCVCSCVFVFLPSPTDASRGSRAGQRVAPVALPPVPRGEGDRAQADFGRVSAERRTVGGVVP
eukprot:9499465-Pyramimonas_sp.AAC.1